MLRAQLTPLAISFISDLPPVEMASPQFLTTEAPVQSLEIVEAILSLKTTDLKRKSVLRQPIGGLEQRIFLFLRNLCLWLSFQD